MRRTENPKILDRYQVPALFKLADILNGWVLVCKTSLAQFDSVVGLDNRQLFFSEKLLVKICTFGYRLIRFYCNKEHRLYN